MPDRSERGAVGRSLTIAVAALVVLAAFAGGYLLAKGGKTAGAPAGPTSSPSVRRSHSPRPTTGPTGTPSVAPAGDLKDGRYFVYVKKVGGTGTLTLTFDLAYFYSGAKADAVAASRGDEVPVPNDIYIVNDNPKLRTYPIAPGARVRYIPTGASTLKMGDMAPFEAAVNGTAPTDYQSMRYSGWWIVIANGQVTSITQQYLP